MRTCKSLRSRNYLRVAIFNNNSIIRILGLETHYYVNIESLRRTLFRGQLPDKSNPEDGDPSYKSRCSYVSGTLLGHGEILNRKYLASFPLHVQRGELLAWYRW